MRGPSLFFRNLVGQRYIALEPGDVTGTRLKPGYVFDLDHTQAALDLTVLFNGFQPLFRLLDPADINESERPDRRGLPGRGPDGGGPAQEHGQPDLDPRGPRPGDRRPDHEPQAPCWAWSTSAPTRLDTTLVTLQQARERAVRGPHHHRQHDRGPGRPVPERGLAAGGGPGAAQGFHQVPRRPLGHPRRQRGRDLPVAADPADEGSSGWPRPPAYGSWVNFYVCSINGRIPDPVGYYGDRGVKPVAGRCK
ncbi:hypothetical protein G5V59_11885 [Nocardioides sp. W3-2-3]|uniref:hypothetical protein n=1 Tax=Nocardioides convexus TaxID=2712224 RepID=UPI0024185D97|nr:hypothetical protein [Nocardioides convexus]NHA00493.1 hypothetical protein [Nocardioides convexus]